ncbi:MAG: nuclear transport factor 2 family protein [Actinomycetota bacterium]|nr:nuclear transport factor 2 family protein [Actinomycetota bacterium]
MQFATNTASGREVSPLQAIARGRHTETVSQENVDRARRTIEAFARGDLQTALQDVRIEVRTHRLAPLPDPRTFRGPAGMLMAWRDWSAGIEDLEVTVGELIDGGHSVVAEIGRRGRRSDSGEEVEEKFWFVYTFFEGELVQQDMLASKRQALKGVAMAQD